MQETQRLQRASRNLIFFTGSEFIGTIGAHVYMFGIGLFVLGLTGSAASFAMTMLCAMVPRIILSPIAGYVVDHLSKKLVVVLSHSLSTITMITILSYTLINGLSLPIIYFTSALLAVFSTFAGIGLTSAIANFVDEARIQRAVLLTQSSTSTAAILGPVLGGVMFGFFSIEVFLLFHAVAYGITTLLEASIHFKLYYTDTGEAVVEPKKGIWGGIKEGAVYVKNHKILFAIMTVALWVNFFFIASLVGLPFIVIKVLSGTSQQLGFIEAMIGVGTLVTSIFLATRPEVRRPIKTIRGGLLALSLVFGLMAVPLLIGMPNWGFVSFFMAIGFATGLLMVIINTPVMVILQKTTPENYRGRVFGLFEMMATGISPLGLILYGFLYDIINPQWIILVSASLLFLVTLYGVRPSRVKDEEVEEIAVEKQPIAESI